MACVRRAVLATLLLIVPGACTGDRRIAPEAELIDSAGVQLRAYDLTETSAPVLHVIGEPDVQVGSVDGPSEASFSRVTDLAIGGNGWIIVSDAVAGDLRVFDANGSYQLTLGGQGDGPGEFSIAPAIVGVSGDTVFAFDAGAARLTSFTLGGDLVDIKTIHETEGRAVAVVRQRNGSFLAQTRWVSPVGPELFPHDMRLELDSVAVLRLNADAEIMDTLLVMPDRRRLRIVQDRGGGVMSTMETITPYQPQAFVRSDGEKVIVARSDSMRVRFLSEGGGVQGGVNVLGVQNPASAEEIRTRQEARLRAANGDEPINPIVRQVNLDYLPERLPAFANIVVSEGGDIWVALSEFDLSEGYDWLVLSPDGELRGQVRTPPSLRLFRVTDRAIFGVWSDELDVPYVRRYPFVN